jgi:hypothetical protein
MPPLPFLGPISRLPVLGTGGKFSVETFVYAFGLLTIAAAMFGALNFW